MLEKYRGDHTDFFQLHRGGGSTWKWKIGPSVRVSSLQMLDNLQTLDSLTLGFLEKWTLNVRVGGNLRVVRLGFLEKWPSNVTVSSKMAFKC